MRTALVTTCFLNVQEYMDKTKRFIHYYNQEDIYDYFAIDETILMDNNSSFSNIRNMQDFYSEALIQRFTNHIPRKSHLEYGYLWRAVYNIQQILQDFDKVIYMDNDFYITSKKLAQFINKIDSGWHTFYCNKHKFPETGCHIIHKNNTSYGNFIKDLTEEEFIKKYNGLTMETTLPVDVIHKEFIGDRYSEYPMEIPNTADFAAQVASDQRVVFHAN